MHKSTLIKLADALVDWRRRWEQRSYRERRVRTLVNVLLSERLRKDQWHLRYLLDSVIPLGDGLNAWLFDHWLYVYPHSLAHGLLVHVYPVSVRQPHSHFPSGVFPFPQPIEKCIDPLYEKHTFMLIAPPTPGQATIIPAFRCFLPDWSGMPRFHGRRTMLPVQTKTTVRLGGNRDDLLAQLLLLAIRQQFAGAQDDLEVWQWLEAYGKRRLPGWAQDFVLPAVHHAVHHFKVPASLRRYLHRVAKGMAQEGAPPRHIQEEAYRLGVSPRTIYNWRRQALSPEQMQARARELDAGRKSADLARELAGELGITYNAARMRISRRMRSAR